MQRLWSIVALSLFLASCVSPSARSANRPPEPGAAASASSAAALPPPSPAALAAANAEDARGPVPISPDDARWGSPAAPVTMVAVTDLECPFCARANPTMLELQRRYGPDQLRVVVKHNPLPFHQQARPAALAAIAVQRARGDAAFFAFISRVFERQQEISEDNLLRWMAEPLPSDGPRPSALSPAEQIDRDIAFAAAHGLFGTPGFLVNGRPIHGAQPLEEFTRVIDEELAAVAAARREGKPASYADRTLANYVAPEPPAPSPQKERDDVTVWQVPVGKSPSLGPPDALVTIIEFSDYQCPFCRRVQPTLDRIVQQYGKDVRIVFKHHPLPFHPRARPAAGLAAAVYREKGNAAFWQVTRSLFGGDPDVLTDDSLLALGQAMKLASVTANAAVKNDAMAAEIDADVELSEDFQAGGTPAFFINGRRLVGAQPFESFAALIDEQLAVASALVRAGTPRAAVYERIMKDAHGPPGLETVELGTISDDRASRGPKGAPVVVQEFSDFQCPFCGRVQPTLDRLRKEFPRDVRVVFRNLPLDFHDRSHAAANAALEARARGGDAAFWRMHDLLFSNQKNLTDENLSALAKSAGIDGEAALAAAREGRYDKVIDEDVAVAGHAGIRGTPAFVVNGYFISGAQPYSAFRRAVLRALADRKAGKLAEPRAE